MTKASTQAATDLLERAITAGIVSKAGGNYAFGQVALGTSKDKAAAFIAGSKDVANLIEAALAPQGGSAAPVNDQGTQVADSAGLKSQAEQSEQAGRAADLAPQPPSGGGPVVTLAFPMPSDVPRDALSHATIVVTSKALTGRRRAGRAFTREETLIPYAELNEEQIAALTGDPELVVSVRLIKPD